jgi:NAD(P)-dependent dehydrogenase (short-subunit alcohol dehydrogenase family)
MPQCDRAMNPLNGKTVLVTGGGRGLGAAIAETLAREGARIVVADLRLPLAQESSARIVAQGGAAFSMAIDVGSEDEVRLAVQRIEEQHDALDVLINNAGTDVTCSIEELEVRDWGRVLQTNLRGPFLLSKAVVPGMRKRGGGHIVNIASTASKRAWPNASAYHASKWGLLGLSHALHAELRPYRIKVSAVIAGGMRTPFLLERFPGIDVNQLQDPAHVATAVKFLLSLPAETVIPEMMVLPMGETSWP